MIIKVTKDSNTYAMAMVNYNEKIYVIPWEEVKNRSGNEEFCLKNITYCVNKNTVTFTLILDDKSLVIVYDAEKGDYQYFVEGKGIIKAVCCDSTVVAVAKVTNRWGMATICRCISSIGSFSWQYEHLNIKKQSYENDEDDYELVVAGADAFVKVYNPLNEVEYLKYIEDNYSIYCLYDYWRDKDIDASDGEPDKNSFYLEFATGVPLTTNKITFCSDPKFAAGYLKYIVLGDAAYMLLLTDSERDELLLKDDQELANDYIPNVDYILNTVIRKNSNKYNIVSLFEEMAEMCDMVFMEKDKQKAIDLLIKASELCNSYFENKILPQAGCRYRLNVMNGTNKIAKVLLSKIEAEELRKNFGYILSKSVWSDVDKLMIRRIIKSIKF